MAPKHRAEWLDTHQSESNGLTMTEALCQYLRSSGLEPMPLVHAGNQEGSVAAIVVTPRGEWEIVLNGQSTAKFAGMLNEGITDMVYWIVGFDELPARLEPEWLDAWLDAAPAR